MPVSKEFELLIAQSSWSAKLTSAQLARVYRDAFEREYPASATVCHRGSVADQWLGVVDGLVKVDTVTKGGRQTTFAGVPAGAWFGEGVLLKAEPRPYSVIALRDSKIGFVPRSTFEWLLDDSNAFCRFVIDQLNARCGYYVALIENVRLHEASARVAFCLAELFNPQLFPGTTRTLNLSQEEIGLLSGLSRQNTNRALHELANAGLLRIEYGSIRVLDLAGLRDFAHADE
ncbi:Crp/Fnr family transcriptional regulator [Burkholderia anthina]|uniref:Crp/Fnr family transcriptional regulator n=1 Tax=Burkholderia anthina TaxID=179879 RepID=UPI0037C10863